MQGTVHLRLVIDETSTLRPRVSQLRLPLEHGAGLLTIVPRCTDRELKIRLVRRESAVQTWSRPSNRAV